MKWPLRKIPEFLADKKLFQYDVILMNFWSGKKGYPGQASRDNLLKFVGEKGKGLFVLHFACGNFKDWSEWANLSGLIFTPKDSAPGLHDPYGPFKIDITDEHHQICKA